jgi:hypothetical protein
MDISRPERTVELPYIEKSISYDGYKQLVENLLAAGKATGPLQSEALMHYSQLNLQRMHRVEKTIQVLPEIKAKLLLLSQPQTWLVLTEGWCGDASQSLPVMQSLAELNPNIRLRILLRDENPELMDRYLTNGVSRSIPKLIAVDPATGKEFFTWGPRPTALQESFYGMRSEGLSYDVIKEELQRWYNKDRTTTIQQELAALATGRLLPGQQ